MKCGVLAYLSARDNSAVKMLYCRCGSGEYNNKKYENSQMIFFAKMDCSVSQSDPLSSAAAVKFHIQFPDNVRPVYSGVKTDQ